MKGQGCFDHAAMLLHVAEITSCMGIVVYMTLRIEFGRVHALLRVECWLFLFVDLLSTALGGNVQGIWTQSRAGSFNAA